MPSKLRNLDRMSRTRHVGITNKNVMNIPLYLVKKCIIVMNVLRGECTVGWSFRKTMKFGPGRLTISKSGISMSALTSVSGLRLMFNLSRTEPFISFSLALEDLKYFFDAAVTADTKTHRQGIENR